jgi:hypothetical protein
VNQRQKRLSFWKTTLSVYELTSQGAGWSRESVANIEMKSPSLYFISWSLMDGIWSSIWRLFILSYGLRRRVDLVCYWWWWAVRNHRAGIKSRTKWVSGGDRRTWEDRRKEIDRNPELVGLTLLEDGLVFTYLLLDGIFYDRSKIIENEYWDLWNHISSWIRAPIQSSNNSRLSNIRQFNETFSHVILGF